MGSQESGTQDREHKGAVPRKAFPGAPPTATKDTSPTQGKSGVNTPTNSHNSATSQGSAGQRREQGDPTQSKAPPPLQKHGAADRLERKHPPPKKTAHGHHQAKHPQHHHRYQRHSSPQQRKGLRRQRRTQHKIKRTRRQNPQKTSTTMLNQQTNHGKDCIKKKKELSPTK
jgi:hypothetical protein